MPRRHLRTLYRLGGCALLSLPPALTLLACSEGGSLLGWLAGLEALAAWLCLGVSVGDLTDDHGRLVDREIGNADRARFSKTRIAALEASEAEGDRAKARLESILARLRAATELRERGRFVDSASAVERLLDEVNPPARPRLKIVGEA